MSVDTKTLQYVADLARLELDEAEVGHLTAQMNDIIAFVEKIDALDTSAIEPAAHVHDVTNVMREDEAVQCPDTLLHAVFENSPAHQQTFFTVPRILE